MMAQSATTMYDVAVVGQGPAGGMTALRLAEAGHSVITFDRKKRVGDPIARPSQLIKSSLVQYISPESGILESILSLFVEIFGTVLSFTFKFCSSAPSAIAWARFLTDPDAE